MEEKLRYCSIKDKSEERNLKDAIKWGFCLIEGIVLKKKIK